MGDRVGHADLLAILRAGLVERYEVERELGSGGMSVVFLARDLRFGRAVAIKVLRPELAPSTGYDRFLQEIQVTARLSHPHILAVLDSGQVGDLLFYVMPFVDGESLQQRLRRETQLPIEEAVRIAREIAEVMSVAHREGLVHRDIKPANILLHGGHAIVADFGIARAKAGGQNVTSAGTAVGTPGYMSIEQASGGEVDARSDVYSLGCVLYEMLAGETPYTGPTAQAILAKQISLPVPSARLQRDTVPAILDEILAKALAKVAADRYESMDRFGAALEYATDHATSPPIARPPRRRRAAVLLIGLTAVTAASWAIVSGSARRGVSDPGALDTTRYAILPLEDQTGRPSAVDIEQRLHDALAWWAGLTIVDPFEVKEVVRSRGAASLTPPAAAQVARALNAGHYIRGTVSLIGDSVRVHATLYDATSGGNVLGNGVIRLSRDFSSADSLLRTLVDGLLFHELTLDDTARNGTRSLPARQSFVRGHRALAMWGLGRADSAFSEAGSRDPQYGQAHLWLALTRAWNGVGAAEWRLAADQASLAQDLSGPDQMMAQAIAAQAAGDLGRACDLWQRVADATPDEYAGWYGTAYCLRSDGMVVPDQRSASRWRFRSSYQQALRAYVRAFQLRPAILAAFRGNAYRTVRSILMTSSTSLQGGKALPPDTGIFRARPIWTGDSIVLLPYPASETLGSRSPWNARQVQDAVERQRRVFRDLAIAWNTNSPQSAPAMEALAVSLEMLGSLTAAVDTMRRARLLARTTEERARSAAAEIWMQIKVSIPADTSNLRAIKALADSVLFQSTPSSLPAADALRSLAALTGRANLAAALAIRAAPAGPESPGTLSSSAPALVILASLGGPVDSLRSLEERVVAQLNDSSLANRGMLQNAWLSQPARLAAPAWRFRSFERLVGKGDVLVDAYAAWFRGDSAAARTGLLRLGQSRQAIPPADRTIDALYPEAALWSSLGDDFSAIAWLDPTLEAIRQWPPGSLAELARAGGLVRAMALRAELAARTNDPSGARRWAEAVKILWSDADEFLQPVVRRMKQLSEN